MEREQLIQNLRQENEGGRGRLKRRRGRLRRRRGRLGRRRGPSLLRAAREARRDWKIQNKFREKEVIDSWEREGWGEKGSGEGQQYKASVSSYKRQINTYRRKI